MNEARPSVAVDYTALLSFARGVARSYSRRVAHTDADDLLSAGYLGLADAIRMHGDSPDFDVLARCRIRGAIRDELRKRDPMSRSARRQLREVVRHERKLTQAQGAPPSEEELARIAGVTPAALRELRAAANHTAVAYDPLRDDRPSIEPVARPSLSPESLVDKRHKASLVARAIPLLSDREQHVIRALYVDGRSLKDIAGELSLSEARICQIHGGAVSKIRDAVGD